jgi:hypothetical protein
LPKNFQNASWTPALREQRLNGGFSSTMSGVASSGKRHSAASALNATACVVGHVVAVAVIDTRTRGLLWWLPVVAAVCFLAVQFRQAWLALVPIVLAMLMEAALPAASSAPTASLGLAMSIILLARSRSFDLSPERASAPFLASCSGWSCAAGLTCSLAALTRSGVAWLGPLLLCGLGLGLGLRSRARAPEAGNAQPFGRAFGRGFVTYVAAFLLLALVALLPHLAMAGANSGSAAPGAWTVH